MTPETYHQDTTRISKSGLDLIAEAPRHYWWKYLSGQYDPGKEAAHFRMGTAFHVACTEPQHFFERYAVAPNVSRATIDGKEAWSDFLASAEGKTVLKSSDDRSRDLTYDQIANMAKSVKSHKIAKKLLSAGIAEQIFTWIDEDTGAPCKCMIDWLTPDYWIVDLKSTKSAKQREFERSVFNYRYHVQNPLYVDGFTKATGITPKGFIFIACEKKAPYCCEVYRLDSDAINQGREAYKRDLATYMKCRETGEWPSYSDNKINVIKWT
jgi:exodeoxyribonuclease VIII